MRVHNIYKARGFFFQFSGFCSTPLILTSAGKLLQRHQYGKICAVLVSLSKVSSSSRSHDIHCLPQLCPFTMTANNEKQFSSGVAGSLLFQSECKLMIRISIFGILLINMFLLNGKTSLLYVYLLQSRKMQKERTKILEAFQTK